MGITQNRRSFLKAAAALTSAAAFASPVLAKPGNVSRGFNLPDWAGRLDGRAPARATLDTLAYLGFSTIRLPVYPHHILAEDSTARLNHIHASVSQLQNAGFAVTLDMHLEDNFIEALQSNFSATADQIDAAWRRLAEVLADLPNTSTTAELLNEPPLNQSNWLALRDRLASTIRKTCPNHTLIWGAASHQGIWETLDTPPLDDANSIAAIHYYWPVEFTHQCADWSGAALSKLRNLPFPLAKNAPEVTALRQTLHQNNDADALALLERAFASDWSYTVIDKDFADIADWSQRTSTPVILNEFGVLDFCVDATSRLNWIAHVRGAAERHGISWAYWELDQGFGFMGDRQDPDSIDYALVAALMAGGPT